MWKFLLSQYRTWNQMTLPQLILLKNGLLLLKLFVRYATLNKGDLDIWFK
jgi:hypothetical protein